MIFNAFSFGRRSRIVRLSMVLISLEQCLMKTHPGTLRKLELTLRKSDQLLSL